MPPHMKGRKPLQESKKAISLICRTLSRKKLKDTVPNMAIIKKKEQSLDEPPGIEAQARSLDRPIKIYCDASLEVWHKVDCAVGTSESCVHLHFVSPLTFESLEKVAMFDLFTTILKRLMSERFDSLLAAELNYAVSPGLKGLWIKANGFDKKLPNFLRNITSCITTCWNLLTEDLFDLAKRENLQIYYSKIMDPEELVENMRRSLTIDYYSLTTEIYAALAGVDFEEFQDFADSFTEHMYVQCFVQGNMDQADAIDTALTCVETLGCRPLLPNTMPQHCMNEIPRGCHCCRIRSFDSNNSQSSVTNYYQFEEPSFKLTTMIEYLKIVMSSPLLSDNEGDSLRGNYEMFGYAITGVVRDEETVEDVDSRIENFRSFLNRAFTTMTEDDLLSIKAKLVKVKNEELIENGAREDDLANWSEIMTGSKCFDREARELELMKKMTVEELRMWMTKFTMSESDFRLRKLGVQIVGYDDSIDADDTAEESDDENGGERFQCPLRYLTRLFHDTKKTTRSSSDFYITNVEEFRRKLNIIPWQYSNL